MRATPVIVIGGPTASGKSGLALALAQAYNGAVINADSLQVYDGLPILTAQPSAEDKAQAPHLLYGVAQPDDVWSAARWRDETLAAIAACVKKGRFPIVAGGTGFYIDALLRGLSPIPPVPAEARAAGDAALAELGTAGLYAKLLEIDRDAALRLEAQNPRRLQRAYEVFLATGKTLAYWQDAPRQGPPAHLRFFTIVLAPPRDVLQDRCAARMEVMMEAGALAETRDFAARIAAGEIPPTAPLTHACGYAPLARHAAGDMSLKDALELMLVDTRQYARRQQTWFRNQITPDLTLETPDATAAQDALAAAGFRPWPEA